MRKTFSGRLSILVIAIPAAITVIVAGCSEELPTAAPTLAPSPTATNTPLPTATAVPTETLAPDFSLPTGTGERYTLDELLAGREALVLVFYRSYG